MADVDALVGERWLIRCDRSPGSFVGEREQRRLALRRRCEKLDTASNCCVKSRRRFVVESFWLVASGVGAVDPGLWDG